MNLDHFQILRAIGKGSFGKVSTHICVLYIYTCALSIATCVLSVATCVLSVATCVLSIYCPDWIAINYK